MDEQSVFHTLEEETSIIGAICQEPKMIRVVAKIVEPDDFSIESCRLVYEKALEYEKENKVFDALILADALNGEIPDVRKFLAECMEVVPTTANTEEYANILHEKSEERDFRLKLSDALNSSHGGKLIEAVAGLCNEKILNRPKNRLVKLEKVLEKTYQGLFEKPENRVDTGYSKLDALLKGMWGGELIIIAARPAIGKSAFALSIAEYASRQKKVVQLYSLEMEDVEIGERVMARWTDTVTMNDLIDRCFSTDDKKNTDAAKAYMKAATFPIYIDDSPNVKPSKVRAQAMVQENLGLIVVDYGGLMSSDKKQDSRNLELGAISRDLKNLAKELKIPIIMLAQLNRGVADSQKPSLRELRDSGELEQNANKVVFLWNIDRETGTVGVSVAKNRKGKCGEVVMHFDGDHMRFMETEERYEESDRYSRVNGGFD